MPTMTSNCIIGNSDAADELRKLKNEAGRRFASRETSPLSLASRQLQDISRLCRTGGWDGCDAVQVDESTLNHAWNLLELLSGEPIMPIIIPEPDGQIDFMWRTRPDCVFSFSVDSDGMLYWAALDGDLASSGRSRFYGDEVPFKVIELIDRTING